MSGLLPVAVEHNGTTPALLVLGVPSTAVAAYWQEVLLLHCVKVKPAAMGGKQLCIGALAAVFEGRRRPYAMHEPLGGPPPPACSHT